MFAFVEQYKWLIQLSAMIAIICGVFYGIHCILDYEQDIGYKKAVAEYTQKQLIAEQEARKKETDLNKKVEDARNESTKREQKINDLSKSLNAATDSLRDTINTLRNGVPEDSLEASRNKSNSALSLLGECQEEYGKLAEEADRHASDVKLLEEAWPE